MRGLHQRGFAVAAEIISTFRGIFSTARRRSRERHSPEWRPADRQSGDWRTQGSTPNCQINFGFHVSLAGSKSEGPDLSRGIVLHCGWCLRYLRENCCDCVGWPVRGQILPRTSRPTRLIRTRASNRVASRARLPNRSADYRQRHRLWRSRSRSLRHRPSSRSHCLRRSHSLRRTDWRQWGD
jgi:hypothetical protein